MPLRLVAQTPEQRLAAFGCFYLSASRNLNTPKDSLESLLKYRVTQDVQAGAREAALLTNSLTLLVHGPYRGYSGVLEYERGSSSEVTLPPA